MKRVFIAFKIDKDGYPVLYKDHPVFSGDACHDLPATVPGNQNTKQPAPEPMICPAHSVREFVSPGECMAAINDYFRVEGEKAKKLGAFVLLEKFVKS